MESQPLGQQGSPDRWSTYLNYPEIYDLKLLRSYYDEYQTVLTRENMRHKGPDNT